MDKKSVVKNYRFLIIMLVSMVAGAIVGWIFPVVNDAEGNTIHAGATVIKPLGTVFINMMFHQNN